MIKTIFAAVLFAGSAHAQEALDYEGFHSVEVRKGIVADVSIGDTSVVIDDSAGDFEQFIPRQFGEWLRLDRNTRWLIWTNGRRDQFSAALTMPEVRELKALSGAVVTGELGEQSQFRAEAENGVLTVSVDTPNLRVRGNAGGQITLSGTCGRAWIHAEPTSSIDLTGMDCDSIRVFRAPDRITLPAGANVVDEHPDVES